MNYNCHTCFSLRYGVLTVGQLLEEAEEKGLSCLALTDINNTSAPLDFVMKAREKGIRPIVGIEFRENNQLRYIGLARNAEGFRHLNEFLSAHLHASALGMKVLRGEGEVTPGSEPGAALHSTPDTGPGPAHVLAGPDRHLRFPARAPELPHTFFIYPFSQHPHLPDLRDNEFIGVKPIELNRLFTSPERNFPEKLLTFTPVTFRNKTGFNTHRLLRSIDRNTILSKQDPRDVAAADETMLSLDEILQLYQGYPHLVTNTLRLMEQCEFEMTFDAPKNKLHFTNSITDDRQLLEKLTWDGFHYRYGRENSEARTRIRKELDVIHRLGFSAYFLVTWDFIRYGQARGFFHVGRGSGANSIVAYCIGITDVDPIELDLYFERFLNPHRTSPPDFDIDFSWTDRDDVIDYVFKRYGQTHTSLMATYNTFKGRSIIRELGKVFGLPKEEIDGLVARRHTPSLDDNIVKLIYRYGRELEGLPNHLGIHPGGILISEAPVRSYSATSLPPKGFPIVQFDMFVAEDAGLYKYDVLSQRGLGHIRSSFELVKENRGKTVDVHDVKTFKNDPKIAELLRTGRTIGCFYVESPAMRQLLTKLRCDNYLTLVAASSVIRPGVARSGMMKQYIERHRISVGLEFNEQLTIDNEQCLPPNPLKGAENQFEFGVGVRRKSAPYPNSPLKLNSKPPSGGMGVEEIKEEEDSQDVDGPPTPLKGALNTELEEKSSHSTPQAKPPLGGMGVEKIKEEEDSQHVDGPPNPLKGALNTELEEKSSSHSTPRSKPPLGGMGVEEIKEEEDSQDVEPPTPLKGALNTELEEKSSHSTPRSKPPLGGMGGKEKKPPLSIDNCSLSIQNSWYLHPQMADILAETYGVMVYQEDVIKVAHYFGGVDLGEADILRRAMSGKYRSKNQFDLLRDKFFDNCKEKGYDESVTAEVWRQMESFSGYSFCKAHSASFAVESYQSLFFKAHYPIEFMVGVVNNFGGFYRTEVYLHEARRAGATVHAPCVNHSVYLTSLDERDIWLGLVHLLGFAQQLAEEIVEERAKNGLYRSLVDLLSRTSLGLESTTTLIRIGALRFTGKSKKTLLWEVNMHFSKAPARKQTTTLFASEAPEWSLPNLPDDPIEDLYDEIELLGFPISMANGQWPVANENANTMANENANTMANGQWPVANEEATVSFIGHSPLATGHCTPPPIFNLLAKPLGEREVTADRFEEFIGQRVVISGYLICTKQVRTIRGDMMGFCDFIDVKGEFFDATLFPQVFMKFPLTGIGIYRMTGKVANDFGVPSLEVDGIERLGYVGDPRRE